MKHTVSPDDILIHQKGTAHITPHKYLLQSGNTAKCIDVAILAEGYTPEEMPVFYEDAAIACESLFAHEPFRSMKKHFNIVAVAALRRQRSKRTTPRRMETDSIQLSFQHILFRPVSDHLPCQIHTRCAGGNTV